MLIQLIAFVILSCINSVGYQPCNMPPDHVIILLEGLTTLCQYCLLDGSAQQDVGVVGQMSPLAKTGSSTDGGLLNNLANVFHFGSQRAVHCSLRSLTVVPLFAAKHIMHYTHSLHTYDKKCHRRNHPKNGVHR